MSVKFWQVIMKQGKLSENNRSRVVGLALLATLLLSVQVGSAYLYQVDVRVDPPSVYIGTYTKLNVQVYDGDHPDWVFPNADINVTWTNPDKSKYSINRTTNSTGSIDIGFGPGLPGNYTFVVSSTYDYNTTTYVQAGKQSATSYPVNLSAMYKTGKVGVFRNSTHLFYLDLNGNGAWNGAGVDRTNNFGIKGDIPVFGEWNGTTLTEIGVFRPSTHIFYLDYNGNGVWNGAAVDKQYNFGITGDLPVSGDWNYDHKTNIGVFRNSTHTFYLDYDGNGVWDGAVKDRQYNFGITGDIPVSGDWNFDGRPEIGVFRPSTHMFYLDYNGNGVWNGASVDKQYNFGIRGDIPVSGDWNNDRISEIGVFRPSTHLFYLDYNGNGVWNGSVTDRQYNFGITGDTPIIGDWK